MPCLSLVEGLEQLGRRLDDPRLRLISVVVEDEYGEAAEPSDAARWLRWGGLEDTLVLADVDRELASAWAEDLSVPTVAVLDGAGEIRWLAVGKAPIEAGVEAAIVDALNQASSQAAPN
ncbi:hypothetical protein PPSIR1_14405 [Plesiocystis pacifica SIR-1]|uniref:TlpA family protein disulfide reductase n=1 Tax=Plesiocystis pacifica SIR-1 TaxID=391625 RepID=A6GJW4_9BACT|nr:hypothetical protein [Plesiocystis pacifica]EDM73843.1 hypothetical protein PPSIR1_14405 [Plesiocystis pacifica SIR-1]